MGIETLIGGGLALGGALLNKSSSDKAASVQQQSAADANALSKQISDDQLALQREMFNKNVELQQPAIDAGNTARNRLMQLLGLTTGGTDNGSLSRGFTDADLQTDPGYAFRLSQGQQGVERSAAARGNLLSGAAAKDMARFSQGLASQEYQAAYDRFNTNRTNTLNPLLSLAGSAQTASTNLGSAASNTASTGSSTLGQYGATASNNLTSAGNARASGYVGGANAISNGLSQAYNGYQQNQLLSLLNKQNSSSLFGGSSYATAGDGLWGGV